MVRKVDLILKRVVLVLASSAIALTLFKIKAIKLQNEKEIEMKKII